MEFIKSNTRHMTPRPGKTYATIYHDLIPTELAKLKRFVRLTILKFEDADATVQQWLESPLKGHRREDKSYYTPLDVMADMYNQLDQGKDLTESMVTRWNAVFGESAQRIDLVDLTELKTAAGLPTTLFKVKD